MLHNSLEGNMPLDIIKAETVP